MMNESGNLLDLQKKMEAAVQEKALQKSEDRARELNISLALLKYLEGLESRLDALEKKVNKLYTTRD